MNFLKQNPCVKGGKIDSKEKHSCFLCGKKIPVGTKKCKKCSLMICPHCQGCFCKMTEYQKMTFVAIYTKYCCNYEHLLNFKKVELKGDKTILKNAEKCLRYCSKRLGAPPRVGEDAPQIVKEWADFPYYWVKEMNLKGTFLDVGCGERNVGKKLLSSVGVDIEKNLKTDYIQGDIRKLPFLDKSFDYVLCFETIEHILEQKQAIDELIRVARKKVFVGSVCKEGPRFIEGIEVYKGKRDKHHLRELSIPEFRKLFELDKQIEFYHTIYKEKEKKFEMKENLSEKGHSNYVVIAI